MTPFPFRAKSDLMKFLDRKGTDGRSKSFVSPVIRTTDNTYVQRAGRANSDSHGSLVKDSLTL